jgi:uncharacterized protein YbaR (Trm112 family)
MAVIYTMERHHELLHLWRSHDAGSLRVVHLDFHCDMRGMLVDRRAGLAYRIRDHFPDLDQGNFLTHAVIDGRIAGIRWVHDEPGGRRDDIGTVKFESDLTAVPHRAMLALRKTAGIALDYQVVRARDWTGIEEGEVLDIDWDYFTCIDYPPGTIQERIDSFWQADSGVVPEETYICYSPEYAHPSRELFAGFVSDLADRFGAAIVTLDPPTGGQSANRRSISSYVPESMYRTARSAYRRAALALKQRGVF